MKIIKRNGTTVDFSEEKIVRAILMAMFDAGVEENEALAEEIADIIGEDLQEGTTVEDISDMVEIELMKAEPAVAKKYILYRSEREQNRKNPSKEGILTKKFLSEYKHKPDPMDQLGSFVYYRTYSRWLPEEKRRERWWETCKRSVEYNCNLAGMKDKEEAERLFDNMFNLRQFLSGRTLWSGGSATSVENPMSNFNCSAVVMDDISMFHELFLALLVGTGVGVNVQRKFVDQLPKFRTDVDLISKVFVPKKKADRAEYTTFEIEDGMMEIIVGDSKSGWQDALKYYLEVLTDKKFSVGSQKIDCVIINYDNIRLKGERLIKFGGKASGYESLMNMFEKINKVIKARNINDKPAQMKPIDVFDMVTIIAENVVVGGIRRSAIITLFDQDDREMVESKSVLYDPKTFEVLRPDLMHRTMSNNSIIWERKPTRAELTDILNAQRFSGEPGFINGVRAREIRPDFQGLNPCAKYLGAQ